MRYAFPGLCHCMRYALHMRYFAFVYVWCVSFLRVCACAGAICKFKLGCSSGYDVRICSDVRVFKSWQCVLARWSMYTRNCMRNLKMVYICDMRYALMHTPVCGSPRFRV